MTTEHKDIEPVVKVSDVLMIFRLMDCGKMTPNTEDGWKSALEAFTIPADAIDTLQAEKAALFAKMDKLEGRAVLAEAQRDELLALSREYVAGKMKPLVDALERVIALQQRTFGYATKLHCGMVDLVFDLKEALEAARKEIGCTE